MSRVLIDTRKFFESPTVEQFEELRQLAVQSLEYDSSARGLLKIEADLGIEKPTRNLTAHSQLSEAFQICPRFHYVEARIRETLGEVAEMHDSIDRLRICLRAISETGEGAKNSPFLITFVTDMDDVVRSFGEQRRCQQSVTGNGRQLDVVTAHSGVEFWFDVTDLAKRAAIDGREALVQQISQIV